MEDNKEEGLLEEGDSEVVETVAEEAVDVAVDESAVEEVANATPVKETGKKEKKAKAPKEAKAPVKKRKIEVIPVKKRDELLKITLDEAKVVEALKAGKDVWAVATEMFAYPFDHADRTSWIFYQKVNSLRKKNNINVEAVKLPPQIQMVISKFREDHTDKQLFDLITRAK